MLLASVHTTWYIDCLIPFFFIVRRMIAEERIPVIGVLFLPIYLNT